MKILHVDDDRVDLVVAASSLKKAGHEVISVQSVEEARASLENDLFDWVICDGQLHKGVYDGSALAERLAKAGHKVVILSTSTQAQRPGIPFISKAEIETLPQAIQRLSEQSGE